MFHRQVWLGGSVDYVSGFGECIDSLFGDSALFLALDSGPVFSAKVDNALRPIGDTASEIDEYRHQSEIMEDRGFRIVSAFA